MDSSLKQRLIGAAVLAALAIVFLPMLLQGPDVKEPDAAEVPLAMPAAPDGEFETRELPLAAPEAAPPGGVLGMDTAPPVPATAAEPAGEPADAPAGPVEATTPPAPTTDAAPVAAAPAPAPVPPTPAPVPEPVKPVAPAAVAAGNYALNIGTFANLDNANALVAKLRAAKLPVISEQVRVKGAPAMRVRIGPYVERAAAEAARLRADEIAGGGSKVIALDGAALPATLPTPPKPAPVATKPSPTPAAPKPAPTPTPTPTPTTTASGFAVQLAAPAEEAAALGLRDRARAAGFAALVQKVDTDAGPRYRVRVGPVADRAAAEALRAAANDKLGINGNIVSHP